MDENIKIFLNNFIKFTNERANILIPSYVDEFINDKYKSLNPHLVFKSSWKYPEAIKCTCNSPDCVTAIKHYEENSIMLIDKYNNENLMYLTKESAKQIIDILKNIK